MSKVILVLADALRYDAEVAGMGYLGHLVENNLASPYKVTGETSWSLGTTVLTPITAMVEPHPNRETSRFT